MRSSPKVKRANSKELAKNRKNGSVSQSYDACLPCVRPLVPSPVPEREGKRDRDRETENETRRQRKGKKRRREGREREGGREREIIPAGGLRT